MTKWFSEERIEDASVRIRLNGKEFYVQSPKQIPMLQVYIGFDDTDNQK